MLTEDIWLLMISLCDLFLLDIFLMQKRAKRRCVIFVRIQSMDEKLCLAGAFAAMDIDALFPDGGDTGRDRSIVGEIDFWQAGNNFTIKEDWLCRN